MADPKPYSPAWWLAALKPKLEAQRREVARFESYYDGKQPVPLSLTTDRYRETFVKMLRDVSDNWCPIVVDAVEERLNVDGFRMPDDTKGDADALAIWQRNSLDAEAELAHTTALTTGRAALMVWAGADGKAEVTVEHPSQVYVAYEAGSARRRRAALKCWCDEWTGAEMANVYLPDGIYKFVQLGTQWYERSNESVDNPLKVVPIVEFRNRRKLMGSPRSELADITSTQDQINLLVLDMIVAAEFGAFRQKWATGIEVPIDPDTKQPIEAFRASIERMWVTGNEEARFGDFQATDLTAYIGAIENRVQSLAARTRTPPHYLLGSSGSFPSGESLKATETGLVAKIKRRQVHFGETWEEAMRLAFAVDGDAAKAEAFAMETIWRDPESRTEAEHVDALVKLRTLQVPLAQLWEDAGYSPTQIDRFREMLTDEAFIESLKAPALAFPGDAAAAGQRVPNPAAVEPDPASA